MSQKNSSSELTSFLFDTLKGIKNGSINVSQAKAISEVAGNIIEVSKTEIEFAKVTKQRVDSKFFPLLAAPHEQSGMPKQLSTGTVTHKDGVTTHRME